MLVGVITNKLMFNLSFALPQANEQVGDMIGRLHAHQWLVKGDILSSQAYRNLYIQQTAAGRVLLILVGTHRSVGS